MDRRAAMSLAAALGASALLATTTRGETPAAAPAAVTVPPGLSKLVTELAREHVPATYDDDRHWGRTAKVWAGVRLEREGWKLETHRRYVEVNHGTWTRYHLALIDPEKNLVVEVLDLADDQGEALCKVRLTARVRCEARVAEWQRGVQLYSFSTVALARVRMDADCVLGLSLDVTKLPPDVLLTPRVKKTKLALLEFEVREVSKARGELAEQLGGGVEALLKEKLADYEAKLPEKINSAIAKKQEKLRLSLADLAASGWQKLIGK